MYNRERQAAQAVKQWCKFCNGWSAIMQIPTEQDVKHMASLVHHIPLLTAHKVEGMQSRYP